METQYTFIVTKDGKVIFTKDVEEFNYPHERLVETVINSLNYQYEDADFYARHLENTCVKAMNQSYRRSKNEI